MGLGLGEKSDLFEFYNNGLFGCLLIEFLLQNKLYRQRLLGKPIKLHYVLLNMNLFINTNKIHSLGEHKIYKLVYV